MLNSTSTCSLLGTQSCEDRTDCRGVLLYSKYDAFLGHRRYTKFVFVGRNYTGMVCPLM